MPVYRDQTGREVPLQGIPKRIVSLVPSQTELMFDLGLHDEVVGITKFCVHPDEWFRTKTRVGGTKQIKIDIIHQLQPDLIIANKEENVKDQIEELEDHYPVWVSDVKNPDDACNMIHSIGAITGRIPSAQRWISEIKYQLSHLQKPEPSPRTAYLVWKGPYMTVGHDTFIHSMLQVAGLTNIFEDRLRYPEVSIEELNKLDCELLLLSSEPFPFSQKHINEIQEFLPKTKILLVDGEMFSWYGSRLCAAADYIRGLVDGLP